MCDCVQEWRSAWLLGEVQRRGRGAPPVSESQPDCPQPCGPPLGWVGGQAADEAAVGVALIPQGPPESGV